MPKINLFVGGGSITQSVHFFVLCNFGQEQIMLMDGKCICSLSPLTFVQIFLKLKHLRTAKQVSNQKHTFCVNSLSSELMDQHKKLIDCGLQRILFILQAI
jgi:hypothetical protein